MTFRLSKPGGKFSLKGTSGTFILRKQTNALVTDGLILHLNTTNPTSYPGSGLTWNDLSGYNHATTLVNGVTFVSGGLKFDGVNDYASVSESVNMTPQVLSFDIKFQVDSLTNTNYYPAPSNLQYILARQNTAGALSMESYALVFMESSMTIRLFTWGNGSSYAEVDTPVIQLGTPYRISGVIDSTTMKLYLNGSLVDTSGKSLGLSYSNTHTLKLGRVVPSVGTWDAALNGIIYDVKFYNRVLSDSEVMQNYIAGSY